MRTMRLSLIALVASIVMGIMAAQAGIFAAELLRLGAFASMVAFLVMANVGWKQAETAAPVVRTAAARKSVSTAHAYHAA